MLKQKILSSLVALSFGASGAVFAQGSPWPTPNDTPPRAQADRGNHGDPRNGYHGDQRAPQRNDYRGNDYRGNDNRGNDHRDNGYHEAATGTVAEPAPTTRGIAATACRPNTAAANMSSTTGAAIT